MTDEEIKKLIAEDPDFIRSPKNSNSLSKLMKKNPDGIEDRIIAKYLMIEEDEVAKIYEDAIKKIRAMLGEKDEQ
jgi:hypothetical protein